MQRFLKFGKKTEAEPRERTADSLISDLESVALAVEGSDPNTTEGNFVPTARCIQHTKERQLVTRSGLQRPRCCVCHLHHELAMNAPVSVKQFIKTVLQQVHTLRLMSLQEMPMRQHTRTINVRRTKICTVCQLPLW